MTWSKWTFLFAGFGLLILGLGACGRDKAGDSKNSAVQDMNIEIDEGEVFDPNAKPESGDKKN